jgi:hypothetical protein
MQAITMALAVNAANELELVGESKVANCVSINLDFEASGMVANGNHLLVNFDNMQSVAVVDSALSQCKNSTGKLIDLPPLQDTEGYEAITRMQDGSYIVVEETYVVGENGKTYHSRARRYSNLLATTNPTLLADADLDYEFKSDNKGIEGAAVVYHSTGKTFLFALCEGNKCQKGDTGRTPGNGKVLVFWAQNNDTSFVYNDKIALPSNLPFVDFSGLDARAVPGKTDEFQVAVVSQTTSSLWLGNIQAVDDASKPSGIDFSVTGGGAGGDQYTFPLNARGELQYCNVEGVSFLAPGAGTSANTRLAFASDKAKSDQPDSCAAKDQSIHIFELAAENSPATVHSSQRRV